MTADLRAIVSGGPMGGLFTVLALGVEAETPLLWGAKDDFQPMEYAERLAEDVPESELVGLEEAYHWVIEDRPEAYREQIRTFLDG